MEIPRKNQTNPTLPPKPLQFSIAQKKMCLPFDVLLNLIKAISVIKTLDTFEENCYEMDLIVTKKDQTFTYY